MRPSSNVFAHWLARKRAFVRVAGGLLPEIGALEIAQGFRFHVALRDRTGPSFYVNYGGPAAFYRYEEADRAAILQWLPRDGVFVDAGANIGLFSVFVARMLPDSRVHAFEPHPLLSRCLELTREANGLSNLVVEACGLSDEERTMILHLH